MPNFRKIPAKRSPVRSSTSAYLIENRAPQFLHLPRRMNQLRTGILSYHGIAFPQEVHLLPGRTIDSPGYNIQEAAYSHPDK